MLYFSYLYTNASVHTHKKNVDQQGKMLIIGDRAFIDIDSMEMGINAAWLIPLQKKYMRCEHYYQEWYMFQSLYPVLLTSVIVLLQSGLLEILNWTPDSIYDIEVGGGSINSIFYV